jgi:preprotein translocase subunit SecE
MATDTQDAAPAAASSGGRGARSRNDRKHRTSPIQYYREIVSELRKVIWPSRQELLTYTAVVLIFVTIMVLIVSGLDYVFTKAVIKAFT